MEYRPVPNGRGAVQVRRRVATSAEGPIDHIQVSKQFGFPHLLSLHIPIGDNLHYSHSHLSRSSILTIRIKKECSIFDRSRNNSIRSSTNSDTNSSSSSVKECKRRGRGRRKRPRPPPQQQQLPLIPLIPVRGRRRRRRKRRRRRLTFVLRFCIRQLFEEDYLGLGSMEEGDSPLSYRTESASEY